MTNSELFYRDKNWLCNQYITLKKSPQKIADENGWMRPTINRWLHKFKISKRSSRDAQLINYKHLDQYRNKKWLEKKYLYEHLSYASIGKLAGVPHSTIQKWVTEFNIPPRPAKPYKGKYNLQYRGFYISTEGYKMIHKPGHHRGKKNGYVPEHVLIMEEYLERPLLRAETVHHKDGDKDNNSIDNLQLLSSESEHQILETSLCLFSKQLLFGSIINDPVLKNTLIGLFNEFTRKHLIKRKMKLKMKQIKRKERKIITILI